MSVHMYVKVEWSRYRPGVSRRMSRGITLLFHDRGTRRGERSAARPGRTLPPGKIRYPFYSRLGGPQGRSGRAENLVPTGIRSRTEYKWRYIILKRRYTLSSWSSGVTDRLRLSSALNWVSLNNQQRATSLLQICARTVLLMCLSLSFVAHSPSCDSFKLQRSISDGVCEVSAIWYYVMTAHAYCGQRANALHTDIILCFSTQVLYIRSQVQEVFSAFILLFLISSLFILHYRFAFFPSRFSSLLSFLLFCSW